MLEKQPDTVLIGKKPALNYVTACVTLFNAGRQTITVRARGLAISSAVDVIELLRRAFIKDLIVQGITIGSQEYERPDSSKGTVSTIDILISKGKK